MYTKYVHEFVLVLIQVELIHFECWDHFMYIFMYYNLFVTEKQETPVRNINKLLLYTKYVHEFVLILI